MGIKLKPLLNMMILALDNSLPDRLTTKVFAQLIQSGLSTVTCHFYVLCSFNGLQWCFGASSPWRRLCLIQSGFLRLL